MNSDAFILPQIAPGDVRRSRDIGRVVNELEALDEGKSWRITIEQMKAERSLKQNRYLWGQAYKLISEGTGYEKPDLHETLLGLHFGTRLKRVPKTLRNREGLKEVPVRTTTTDENGRRAVLGKTPFSEFVDFVKRWASEGGIHVPDPDPSLAIYATPAERKAAQKAA